MTEQTMNEQNVRKLLVKYSLTTQILNGYITAVESEVIEQIAHSDYEQMSYEYIQTKLFTMISLYIQLLDELVNLRD